MPKKPRPASHPENTGPIDLFEAMGGSAKCFQLSSAFYSRAGKDPVLSRFFPGKTHKCAIEAFAAFLVQFLGGPSAEAQRRSWLSLRESHLRFQIGKKERDTWVTQMVKALDDVEISDPMRYSLRELFEEASAYLANAEPRRPKLSAIDTRMGRRWEEQCALDEAVAAVREGELSRVIALVEHPLLQSRFQSSRAVFAHFLDVLIRSGKEGMAEYATRILLANPDLAHERYSGRSLLHGASAAGNVPLVIALLKIGSDVNGKDEGGHTPLYSVASECPGGSPVVSVLIQAGANVDACDGVKRCSALHMAARRGHVDIAEALLECGANIEARDSLGETPLRRAVNCGQPDVAALLLAKGANRHSVGSKGLTPLSAARSAAMRSILQT